MTRQPVVWIACVAAAWASCASVGATQRGASASCRQLVEQLRPDQPDMKRYEAAVGLAALGTEAACAIDPLRAATRDDWFIIRAAAVRALGSIGPAALGAAPDVMARWTDREVSAHDIVTALNGLGPRVMPQLVPYLDAKRGEDEVAAGSYGIAAQALGTFGARAVPLLIRALRRPQARVAAADALRYIGPDAEPAVPALVVAYDAKGSDRWDRGAVLSALHKIGARACAARTLLERLLAKERSLGQVGPPSYEARTLTATLAKLAACSAAKPR